MQVYHIDAWADTEFGQADLGDARRTARLVQLATVLGAQPTASLPDATDDPATLKAAYRFFANDAVDPAEILASHVTATVARLRQVPHVLAVQDTTYLDWTTHPATTRAGAARPCHAAGLAGPYNARHHPRACPARPVGAGGLGARCRHLCPAR